ncbi:hypothetical protein V6N13_064413 [Hibiscus sabdariffa]
MGSLWLSVVVVIMISVLVLEEAKWGDGCWDEERTALFHLKTVFRFSRTQVGSDCCDWNWGWVQCDVATRRVIGLSLYLALYYNPSAQQFTHLFNASLFLPFQDLRILDLSYVGLVGYAENEDIDNLRKLDSSENGIESLQSSHDNRCLKKLRFLYLDTVSTRGSTSLASLLEPFPSVKTLFLRYNYFSNETVINQQLHVLRNVENLIMDYTPLPINFLESIGILTSLRTLSLYDCGLTGTLPAQGYLPQFVISLTRWEQ